MNLSALNTFKSSDKILVDANVLIYVFCPLNSSHYDNFINHYTDTLQKIANANASVFVNSLIISEFINRWLRMDFQRSGLNNFKQDYRASGRYTKTIKSILRELKKFYTQCNVRTIDDNFSNIDYQNKYAKFLESDFNDIIIAENALSNGCKILTQDRDFTQYGVSIIR
jgi:predicted nucleic acid-binding protein